MPTHVLCQHPDQLRLRKCFRSRPRVREMGADGLGIVTGRILPTRHWSGDSRAGQASICKCTRRPLCQLPLRGARDAAVTAAPPMERTLGRGAAANTG